jgi:hypothetical protein
MRKLLLLIPALCLTGFLARPAHAQVEIFGGYSYMRPSITYTVACPGIPPCPTATAHPNFNGWELTGVLTHHWIGLAADLSGEYGSVAGASTHVNTYLFGPQVRLPGPVSPFAHVLVGVAHESIGGATDNSIAAAAGAGIDIHVAPFISFRPIQLDYIVTRFGSGTQSQPRASAGLVLHF